MRPTYTTNGPQTMFSWLVDQEARLHRQLQLMRARRALRRAFARFAAEHPQLVASLFDAHFIETRVAPLVARSLEAGLPLRPEALSAAWLSACRGLAVSAADYDLAAVTAAAATLLAALEAELRPEAAAAPAEDTAAVFAAAVRADSNLELDWLWLAGRLRDHEQRRFCYEKALFINPQSEAARQALAALDTLPAPAHELALGEV